MYIYICTYLHICICIPIDVFINTFACTYIFAFTYARVANYHKQRQYRTVLSQYHTMHPFDDFRIDGRSFGFKFLHGAIFWDRNLGTNNQDCAIHHCNNEVGATITFA